MPEDDLTQPEYDLMQIDEAHMGMEPEALPLRLLEDAIESAKHGEPKGALVPLSDAVDGIALG